MNRIPLIISFLFSILVIFQTASPAQTSVRELKAQSRQQVAAIDSAYLQKVEFYTTAERRDVAYFDFNNLRKIEVTSEVDTANTYYGYYFDKEGRLFYAVYRNFPAGGDELSLFQYFEDGWLVHLHDSRYTVMPPDSPEFSENERNTLRFVSQLRQKLSEAQLAHLQAAKDSVPQWPCFVHRYNGATETGEALSMRLFRENGQVYGQLFVAETDTFSFSGAIEGIDFKATIEPKILQQLQGRFVAPKQIEGVITPDSGTSFRFFLRQEIYDSYIYNYYTHAIAAPEKVFYLNLYEKGYQQFPDTIDNLLNLKSLDLSHNAITEIPECISRLQNLRSLNLSNNQINRIDTAVCRLSELQYLFLYANPLIELPHCIGNLSQLKELNLYQTHLPESTLNDLKAQLPNTTIKTQPLPYQFYNTDDAARVPEEVVVQLHLANLQLRRLPPEVYRYPNLKLLDVSKNQLTEIDEQIRQLIFLNYLNCNDNNLTTLPETLSELPQLEVVLLNNNSGLNAQQAVEVLSKLTSVKTIELSGCGVGVFPAGFQRLSSLERLSLSYNQIENLPEPIPPMPALRYLDLSHNPALKTKTIAKAVENLYALEKLIITGTDINQRQLEKLQDALPQVEIVR